MFLSRQLQCESAVLLLATLPISMAPAQSPGGRGQFIAQESGAAIGDNFGQECALLGDLNGDGCSEWLVGAPLVFNPQVGRTGAAYVYSGADGTLLYEYLSSTLNQNFGSNVAGLGDLDRDGVNDFVIMGLLPAAAHVYSGATGAELFVVNGLATEHFGWRSLAAAGDLNQDGHDDFLVGAYLASPGIGNEGTVYAYSGADGSEILRIEGQVTDAWLGWAIDGGHDLNGDGVPDILASSPQEDDGLRLEVGAIRIFSGRDGSELLDIPDIGEEGNMGVSLCFLSDLTGDAIPEVLSGTTSPDVNATESGAAFVHCGATGALIHRLDGFEFEQLFGSSCAAVGDLTGDGFADFAIGSLRASNPQGVEDVGRVDLFSGCDARLIHSIYGNDPFDGLSRGLDGGHDVDGDGRPDILVSAPQDFLFLSKEGTAIVYSYESFLRIDDTTLSVSQGGTITVTLDFPQADAGAGYALLANFRGEGVTTVDSVEVPLARDPLLDRMLAGQAPSPFLNPTGRLDAAAQAVTQIVLPPQARQQLIGRCVSLAAVSVDRTGVQRSSGSVFVELVP